MTTEEEEKRKQKDVYMRIVGSRDNPVLEVGTGSNTAWPGFFWLGLAWLLASNRSWHITTEIRQMGNGNMDTKFQRI